MCGYKGAVGRRISFTSTRPSVPKVAPSPEPSTHTDSRASLSERAKPSNPFSPPPRNFRSLLSCCGSLLPFRKPTRDLSAAGVDHPDPTMITAKPDSATRLQSDTDTYHSLDGDELLTSTHPMLPPITSSEPLSEDIIASVTLAGDVPTPKKLVPGWEGVSGTTDDYSDSDVSSEEEAALRANPQLSDIVAATGTAVPPLLPKLQRQDYGKKCLVLDLDETLVHSSFRAVENADTTVAVELEGQVHDVYVLKRPGVDQFLKEMGNHYEIVVFTASLAKYADPVLDWLDIHKVVRHRLFRESCILYGGNYVKDLSRMGRPLTDLIILDNSAASYAFHPNNAIPITSWFNDTHDTELLDLIPFLVDLEGVPDVVEVLKINHGH
ncbi:hypothetical protein H4R35_005698 [Dimargaris xerosporica]|nr:hypothetical protein H4R35_005698 [Dimargaris xerosporica]